MSQIADDRPQTTDHGGQWSVARGQYAENTEDLLTNPIYAGMGPHRALVPEEDWVDGAVYHIREKGAAHTVGRILAHWEEMFSQRPPPAEGYVADAEKDPKAAVRRLLIDLRQLCEG